MNEQQQMAVAALWDAVSRFLEDDYPNDERARDAMLGALEDTMAAFPAGHPLRDVAARGGINLPIC